MEHQASHIPSISPGVPEPLGCTRVRGEASWNFAVRAPDATGLEIRLFERANPGRPVAVVTLERTTHRTGRTWHARVPQALAPNADCYDIRADGPPADALCDHRFDPRRSLLDPYATSIWFPPGFDRSSAIGGGDNTGSAPLARLDRGAGTGPGRTPAHLRHWARPDRDVLLYELHVRGLTRDPSSGITDDAAGTFEGVVRHIPHLRSLGVTTVELMPVTAVDPQEGNFWGYMPLGMFALREQFARTTADEDAAQQFRAMVDELHDAGFEVILDLVQNHTAEAHPDRGPTYGPRGLANGAWLHPTPGAGGAMDYSGTGNTLRGDNPDVVRWLVDAQRYWLERFDVDGFRHDLFAALMRDGDGRFMSLPPLVAAMRSDPVVRTARHTGEPWDAAEGGFLLGTDCPDRELWQWNAKFRDDVRRFVRGDDGMVGPVMRRMYGSDVLFPPGERFAYRPCQSINYIASHDGFTLYDLVSYTEKRNHANGHDNADGPPNEISTNCGHEGDEGVPPEVIARRVRLAKNLLTILMLSNGTPLLRAGDELLNSQGGNSNPYNQDNPTGWVDWSGARRFPGFVDFVRGLIRFRREHGSIGRDTFWGDDVSWHGAEGPISFDDHCHHFAYRLRPEREGQSELYVLLNMEHHPVRFDLSATDGWRLAVDTAAEATRDMPSDRPSITGRAITVAAQSITVLVRPSDAAAEPAG